MTCQGCPRSWNLSLPHNALRSCIPVPQQNGTIGRTGSDIAIRRNVTLRPGQTRHNVKVSKDDLDDFGRFRREHSEAVVPESAGDQESAVYGGHVAVRFDS